MLFRSVISLKELCDAIDQGLELPEKSVVITMDDGYQSNYVYAYPVMQKYNIKATIALITEYLVEEHKAPFNPEVLTWLSWQQIKEMQASGLVDFQAHTHAQHHYRPVDASGNKKKPMLISPLYDPQKGRVETKEEYRERVREDLRQCKEIIETRLGTEAFAIFYPFGAYNHQVQDLAQEVGYKMQLSIKNGLNRYGDNLREIRRVNVSPQDSLETFIYKLETGSEKISKKSLRSLLKRLLSLF